MALHIWKNHAQFDWVETQDMCKELMREKLVSNRGTQLQQSSKEFNQMGPLKDFTEK